MPFGNPIVGGTTLVRPAIKSPNFVAGVSGWQVAKDGSAEFNNIVIRGSTTTQGLTLMYSGTPAAGNLILSISPVAGVDAYGNAYVAGEGLYGANGKLTAKNAAGNTAVLTGNIPGGGSLSANPGLAMQPVRNTGDPAIIGALDQGGPLPVEMALLLTSPSPVVGGLAGSDYAQIYMTSPNGPVAPRSQSGVTISAANIDLNGSSFASNGRMSATNRAVGFVTITPTAANTPTSATVTFPALTGTSFTCLATANSSVPGTQMLGVSYTGVSSTGVTLWLTRTNLTATTVSYVVEGF